VTRLPALVFIALLGALVPTTPALAAPGPTAQITSPANKSTVPATSVPITATGTTSAGDTVGGMTLLFDGSGWGYEPCPAGSTTSCSVSINFDFSGWFGTHTLQVQFDTTNTGAATLSPIVTVTVQSAPTASISSPADGSAVNGTVQVGLDGSPDPAKSDWDTSIDMLIDGGQVANLPCTDSGMNTDCTGSGTGVVYNLDTTGLSGQHTLQARLHTQSGDTALSPLVHVTVAGPPPTTSITSPAAGATVSGWVSVQVTGAVTAAGDSPASMQLYADGYEVDVQPCPAASSSCPVTLTWDSTWVTGPHTLAAHLVTANGAGADSAPVSVNVTTPPPTAVISSPGDGTVVSGTVTVSGHGTTDSRLSDVPVGMDLIVDGVLKAQQACATWSGPHACEAPFDWVTTGLAGTHQLQTRVHTQDGQTALSPVVRVLVASATRTSLSTLPIVRAGTVETVRGRLVATANGAGLGGQPVRLTLRPTVGTARAVTVTTGATGYFAYTIKPVVNTTVSASVAARPGYGASSATTTARVLAPFSCALTSASLRHGTTGRGTCKVPYLPTGTAWTLKTYSGGRWVALKAGKTTSSTVAFSFTFSRTGTYQLRLVLAASHPYVASLGPVLKVVVT
jgi:hypothetical protein